MTLLRRSAPIALALSLLLPSLGTPWGATGHRTVALVAESLLTPQAQTQVADLLGPTTTLADVADWADEMRPARPHTGPWHYVNIPRAAEHYDAARDCLRGCVISALHQFLSVLADARQDRSARQEALRWVVHLVADVHQPLHAVDDHDRGGNDVAVRFFGVPSNLHRVWDSDIIDRTYADPGTLRTQVLAAVTSADRRRWEAGGPEQWAEESHRAAVEVAYALPPNGDLGDPYVARALPVITDRLAKAAVRLAGVLNTALGPH
jgi:hypothetical protein